MRGLVQRPMLAQWQEKVREQNNSTSAAMFLGNNTHHHIWCKKGTAYNMKTALQE